MNFYKTTSQIDSKLAKDSHIVLAIKEIRFIIRKALKNLDHCTRIEKTEYILGNP